MTPQDRGGGGDAAAVQGDGARPPRRPAQNQPAESTAQLADGGRLPDGGARTRASAAARCAPPASSELGSRQSTPPRPGEGADNEIDAWRFVQATDVAKSADVPEALRVDAGARLAGDDLFAVADGGAATSDLRDRLAPRR